MTNMEFILTKLKLEEHIHTFENEKITPDIVSKLSLNEMRSLGIIHSADIMKLRVECLRFGQQNLPIQKKNEPKFDKSKEVLEGLIDAGFSVLDMSKLLSVSERTVYRKMSKYDLRVYDFTDIDDECLHSVLRDFLHEFPRCGESMIRQILKSRGIKVARSRLRNSLRCIDVEGIKARRKRTLHRRVYCVSSPNHLWHIDTNHKLIHWNFIIAGGIDGFSRFIVYLKCINNNKAQTILECFMEGVEKYGIPVRVRSDQDLENYSVAMFMIQNRGDKGMITGKSTHNQRIERLWRDVYEGAVSVYYELFYFMEDEGLLNPLDNKHIYALHHVYFDKINEKLCIWQSAWASHRLRTIRSSPGQLFISGCLNYPVTIAQPSHEIDEDLEDISQIDQLQMENPRPLFESTHDISENCQRELDLHCLKGRTSSYYGIDMYIKALEIIQRNPDP